MVASRSWLDWTAASACLATTRLWSGRNRPVDSAHAAHSASAMVSGSRATGSAAAAWAAACASSSEPPCAADRYAASAAACVASSSRARLPRAHTNQSLYFWRSIPSATRQFSTPPGPPSVSAECQFPFQSLSGYAFEPGRLPTGFAGGWSVSKKILLDENDIPERWYNILPDMPAPPAPYLHPATLQPMGPADLAPIFYAAIIAQEVSAEPWIEIPDQVREIYRIWRPSPLYRADRLEKALDTPAHIYFKYEGVSPAGSHKPNTAVPQAYYNAYLGDNPATTETGAGQWGSALAFAGTFFDIEVTVYMVRISYDQKPYRRALMETWGATVFPSPSDRTSFGRALREKTPDSPGSLGIAISEAVEDAATRDDSKYALGSVLNHVLMHQTVVGLEVRKQLEKADDEADILVGCIGGGSNFAGFSFPFAAEKLTGKNKKRRIVAIEPSACPSLTKGKYVYDFGDTVGLTPLVKMHTLGHTFVPAPLHAGGLRYHGMAPLVCKLYEEKYIEAVAVPQVATFEAAMQFARSEGIIPAPESAHAIRVVIDEAKKCKEAGRGKAILFNLSGHGHFDLSAYEAFLTGKVQDYELPSAKVEEALRHLPQVKA